MDIVTNTDNECDAFDFDFSGTPRTSEGEIDVKFSYELVYVGDNTENTTDNSAQIVYNS